MNAVVQDTYGSPDVLELREIDKPIVNAGEVLVRVRAAGVDPGVWHLMTGMPYLIRVMGFGLRAPKWHVRGRDLAGRVEAVGENVTQFKPGDVPAPDADLRLAQPVAHDAHQVRPAGHDVPDAGIHAGRAHLYEHLVIPDHRLVDLPELQHIG